MGTAVIEQRRGAAICQLALHGAQFCDFSGESTLTAESGFFLIAGARLHDSIYSLAFVAVEVRLAASVSPALETYIQRRTNAFD